MFINKVKTILDLNKFQDDVKEAFVKVEGVILFGVDDLRFTLTEALTVQEDIDLDALIVSFVDSDPEQSIPKIYDIVKAEIRHKHYHNINYKKELISALIPKRTVTRGEVTKVDWYRALDVNMVPTDKILSVDIAYSRDATGFATSRVTTRTWINRDETLNTDTKTTYKYYFINSSDMIDEGLKRRKLLVNSIQIPTLNFMMEVLMPLGYTQAAIVLLGRAFMDDYDGDFNRFVQNSSTITDPADPNVGRKSIIVEIENNDSVGRNKDYNLWLDKAPASIGGQTTIRQYFINEFSI